MGIDKVNWSEVLASVRKMKQMLSAFSEAEKVLDLVLNSSQVLSERKLYIKTLDKTVADRKEELDALAKTINDANDSVRVAKEEADRKRKEHSLNYQKKIKEIKREYFKKEKRIAEQLKNLDKKFKEKSARFDEILKEKEHKVEVLDKRLSDLRRAVNSIRGI